MAVFLRRLLICTLCLVLAAPCALASTGVHFTITADIDPVQWDSSLRPLMEGLDDLADVCTLEGVWEADDACFTLTAWPLLPLRDSDFLTHFYVDGIDSHWRITADLLGDTVLMLNNLALAEFGVKAWNHLGIPVQYAALAVPYTHTSALAVLHPVLAPLFPEREGVTVLSADDIQALAGRIASLAQSDRTLRCYIEALGIATGADQFIFEALTTLPDALAALCPEGLTITRTENALCWLPTDPDDTEEETPLLSLTRNGPSTALNASLPGFGSLILSLRDDVTILTGTLHTESPLLTGEIAFSLPQSLPVTMPFFLTVDASGMLLGGTPLQLVYEGEAHANTLTIRQLLPDHSRTMMTLTATLESFESSFHPGWTSADLTGVNILSVTGASLGELMREVAPTLTRGLFDLVTAMPASTCQALMDLLDDSGILPLLADAMSGSYDSY